MKYKLYQIPFPKDGDEKAEATYMNYCFKSLNRIDGVKIERYEMVYEGEIPDEIVPVDALEMIYMKLNARHPAGYKTRSVSVSDIVFLNNQYYYCDSFGWKRVYP